MITPFSQLKLATKLERAGRMNVNYITYHNKDAQQYDSVALLTSSHIDTQPASNGRDLAAAHMTYFVDWLCEPTTFLSNDGLTDQFITILYSEPRHDISRELNEYSVDNAVLRYLKTETTYLDIPFEVSNCHLSTMAGIVNDDGHLRPFTLMRYLKNNDYSLSILDKSHEGLYKAVVNKLKIYNALLNNYPQYEAIYYKGELCSLIDLLDDVYDQDPSVWTTFSQLAGTSHQIDSNTINQLLNRIDFESTCDLKSEHDSIETFIAFSNNSTSQFQETVTDNALNKLRSSEMYAIVLNKLAKHGLNISKTQQDNVLQQVLATVDGDETTLFNLSDMGSGKTLMTVETLFLTDLLYGESVIKHLRSTPIKQLTLPPKNIIAPKLSIESSWLETIAYFYTIEPVPSDNDSDDAIYTYRLTTDYKGIELESFLHVSPFTVSIRGVSLVNNVTNDDASHVVIDEVHQLVRKPIGNTLKLNPSHTKFVLSGTLSNLTVTEWFNYLTMVNDTTILSNESPSQTKKQYKSLEENHVKQIRQSNNIASIDDDQFIPITVSDLSPMQSPLASKAAYFQQRYGKHALRINYASLYGDDARSLPAYLKDIGGFVWSDAFANTINFKLFYDIVGPRAVTANSRQIATELFGEQATQYKSDVIKTTYQLTPADLLLVKDIYNITQDVTQYQSPIIAQNLTTALLNLNDGLSSESIYDIVSRYANTNQKFFSYLSGLDLDVLKRLRSSNLIQQPKLKATEKFKVLKDILAKEPNETHLIVVNTLKSSITLAKALGIKALTKQDLKNSLQYQTILDELFAKQSIVVVPQDMVKSSLDLVQANRLIQYQLNNDITDIIQTQNRINRIGQTRETKAYYIVTDRIQESIVETFLETYRNISVAHEGITQLFTDLTTRINIVDDYLGQALTKLDRDTPIYKEEPLL